MPTLTLSQLVAGRDLATAAVQKLGAIEAAHVVVDARPLISGSTSFAGQLVRSALVDGGAAKLTVVGGPPDFLDDIRIAAKSLDLTERVAFAANDVDLGVAS
jgi:hypothetical protein